MPPSPTEVGGHGQQGTDGRLRAGDLGPGHPRGNQSGDGSQRRRRHPDPCGVARGHLGRPHHRPLRHPQRHLQLHPDGDGEARRALGDGPAGGAEPGLRGGRSQRRYGRHRRALQAGDSGGFGIRREDHAFRYFHGRYPPHLAARFPLRAPAWAHHPADLRGAPDRGRVDSVRAPGADSRRPPSSPACRRLQRRVGERRLRRGYVLLRTRAPDRCLPASP